MNLRHVKYLAVLATAAIVVFTVSAQNEKSPSSTSPQTEKKERGLVFSVFGDWGRNGIKNQTAVAKVMAEKRVGNFIISAGDNFQIAGVRSVNDPLWNVSYESVYSDPALYCDWYCALGNHDYSGNVQAEIDYSKISRRWNMGGRYYSFHKRINDSASADFYIIDTPPFQSEYYKNDEHAVAGQDTAKQMRWIDSCLTNSKATGKSLWGIIRSIQAEAHMETRPETCRHALQFFSKQKELTRISVGMIMILSI
jgi:tartrate-resistant acid phosphatase type 5